MDSQIIKARTNQTGLRTQPRGCPALTSTACVQMGGLRPCCPQPSPLPLLLVGGTQCRGQEEAVSRSGSLSLRNDALLITDMQRKEASRCPSVSSTHQTGKHERGG